MTYAFPIQSILNTRKNDHKLLNLTIKIVIQYLTTEY